MKKSAFISDILFAFLAVFLPAVCVLRYFRFSLTVSVLLAALAGVLSSLSIYMILSKKREKLCLKKQDEETRDKLLLHLTLQGEKATLECFLKYCDFQLREQAEENAFKPAQIKEFKGISRIETETEDFYPFFTLCPLDADKIAPILYDKRERRRVLLCSGLTDEAKKLCVRFGIETLTGNDVYLALKKAELLPEHYIGEDALPQKKKRLHAWFAKSNSRRFLTGGTLILVTSLITPFPLYYVISGNALILSAVFVRIFGYR